MDIYSAIKQRRTVKQYGDRAVPREVIERMLDAAVWAPNHHLTEPWRFTVLTGSAKDELAALRRRQVAERFAGTPPQAALNEAYAKMAGAAALIVVTCQDGTAPEVTEENRFATAAATQNLLLAATAEGLASFWSTGIARYQPARDYLHLAPDEFIVGIVHLGYPAQERPGRRTAATDKTRWFDSPPEGAASASVAASTGGDTVATGEGR